MIYQDYGKKYRYLIKFELDNYDYLCQVSRRNDVSIAYLINSLIESARKGHIRIPGDFEGHATNGSCQKSL